MFAWLSWPERESSSLLVLGGSMDCVSRLPKCPYIRIGPTTSHYSHNVWHDGVAMRKARMCLCRLPTNEHEPAEQTFLGTSDSPAKTMFRAMSLQGPAREGLQPSIRRTPSCTRECLTSMQEVDRSGSHRECNDTFQIPPGSQRGKPPCSSSPWCDPAASGRRCSTCAASGRES